MELMKLKKLLALLTAVAVLLTCLTACDSSSIVVSDKDLVIAEAQGYLEEKYPDDTFTYVSGRSPSWAYDYYELSYTSEIYDEQKITVYGELKSHIFCDTDRIPDTSFTEYDSSVYRYFDTYYEYSMEDEAEEYFYDIASDYLSVDSTDIIFSTSPGDATYVDNKESFFINATNNTFYVIVQLKTSEYDSDNILNFLEEISSYNFKCSITILYKLSGDGQSEYSGREEYYIKYNMIEESIYT